jgi:1-acyl-sn-glycerol-3-phosphate acyltransferase
MKTLEKLFDPGFEKDKNDGSMRALAPVLGFFMHYYNIEYTGMNNIPKNGPALVSPKHISWQETPIVPYTVYKATNRMSYTIAKAILPRWFEHFGILRVIREKDARVFRERGVYIPNDFRATYNEELLKYSQWLLTLGEIITSWAEGTRFAGKTGKMKTGIIEMARDAQAFAGPVPFVPVGIEYEHKDVPRSRVYVRVGEPIIVPPDYPLDALCLRIQKDMQLLSNIKP